MSLLTDEEVDVLRRLLRVLDGVVPEFVIAGGQAARLLRLHPLAVALEWKPLLTTDTDVATQDKGHRGKDLSKAFQEEGFEPSYEGDDRPPRTHYIRGNAEVELIVPDVARRNSTGETAEKLGDARTDFVGESARQAEGRPGLHTAEAIALANRLGLKELLGL